MALYPFPRTRMKNWFTSFFHPSIKLEVTNLERKLDTLIAQIDNLLPSVETLSDIGKKQLDEEERKQQEILHQQRMRDDELYRMANSPDCQVNCRDPNALSSLPVDNVKNEIPSDILVLIGTRSEFQIGCCSEMKTRAFLGKKHDHIPLYQSTSGIADNDFVWQMDEKKFARYQSLLSH